MAFGGRSDILIKNELERASGSTIKVNPDQNFGPMLTETLNNLCTASSAASAAISDTFGYVSSGTSFGRPSGCVPSNPLMQQQPMLGTDLTSWTFPPSESPCKEYHVLTEELLQVEDDEVVGTCGRCGVRVFVPRIAGAFSFERAGAFIGRAMSLDSEDPEENLGELMAELAVLEKQIKRDQARLERSREILVIARNMAKKHSVKELVG